MNTMDALINGLSIRAKKELQSLCCIMGKTMSPRCHVLAAKGGYWQASFGTREQPYLAEALLVWPMI